MSFCMTCGQETQLVAATCSNCGAQMVQGVLAGAPERESVAKFWLAEWFSFSGRISRRSFWLGHELPMLGIIFLSLILDGLLKLHGLIFGTCILLQAWPNIATQVKRAHDRGRSGWFVLLAFVPIVSLWPAIELGFLRGDVGPNRFGADPLGASTLTLSGR
jgi:uncharacterized membrane protein YhaH (DUF805 family)